VTRAKRLPGRRSHSLGVPSHAIRLQLFGIALILVGGLASVQAAAAGYGYVTLYGYLVLTGLLASFAGLCAPLLAVSDDAERDGADA